LTALAMVIALIAALALLPQRIAIIESPRPEGMTQDLQPPT